MAIVNCKDCGKICSAGPSGQCPDCILRTRLAEAKVSEYLEDHQNSTLEEIHQATGVERYIIMQMIRKGLIAQGTISYPCESCRSPIRQNRLCPSCVETALQIFTPRESPPAAHDRHKGDMYTKQLVFKTR